MKTYPVPLPLLQAIISFLQRQPWADVNEMLAGIHRTIQETDQPTTFAPHINGGVGAQKTE